MKKDKFISCFISGLSAIGVKNIILVILLLTIKLPSVTFWDYAATIGFGRFPQSIPDFVLAILLEISFGIAIGIIICVLLNVFKTKHHLIAGGFWGGCVWFSVRMSEYVFKLEQFKHVEIATASINYSLSIVFGIMVAYVQYYLENEQ